MKFLGGHIIPKNSQSWPKKTHTHGKRFDKHLKHLLKKTKHLQQYAKHRPITNLLSQPKPESYRDGWLPSSEINHLSVGPAPAYPVRRARNHPPPAAGVRKMLSVRPPHTTFSRPLIWPRRSCLGVAAAPRRASAVATASARDTAAPPGSVSFPILVRISLVASDVLLACSVRCCAGTHCLCHLA